MRSTTTISTPNQPGPPPITETEVDDASTTPPATFQGIGFFIQDEITIGRWGFTPGIRYDRFDIDTEALDRPEGLLEAEERTEESFSGSLGVVLNASDAVRPIFSIGRAFRTPNVIERYFFGPGSQGGLTVPNPDLENETSLNVDVGLKIGTERFRGSVTYFHNRVKNLITFVAGTFEGSPTFGGQPVSQVDNVGDARLQGFELEGEFLIPTSSLHLLFLGSLSVLDGKDLDTDDPLFVVPLKGVFGVRVADPRNRYSTRFTMRATDGQNDVPEGFSSTSGFAVFDAHASADLSSWLRQDVTVRVGIENIADREYQEPYNIVLAPGRNLELGLSVGVGGGS